MNSLAWSEIVSALASGDVDTCVNAASRMHAESSAEDVPALLGLLETGDFFVREAAAWPLAELAGLDHLPELLRAYQRGFDEGHDNDGFSTALLEIPALFPAEARRVIEALVRSSDEPLRGHAEWLLDFCQPEAAR
ncbi:hypothetical protein [Roseateles cavernae]|uniref:hypothetical protein n=1 Tax=Roseateles cavernae TaxID=3153578 RepID=UPI0032E51D8A